MKTEPTWKIHLILPKVGKNLPVFSPTGISGFFPCVNQKCTGLSGKWKARMLPAIQDSWEPHSDKQWPVEGCESPGHPLYHPLQHFVPASEAPSPLNNQFRWK